MFKYFRSSMNGASFFMLILLCGFSLKVLAQVSIKGPAFPPPGSSLITSDNPSGGDWIGRESGITFTFSGVTLANTTSVYWTILPDSVMLSMDGSDYDSTEILIYNPDLSDLENGHAAWTGSTFLPVDTGSPQPLLSRLLISVTDVNDVTLNLKEGSSLGLPVNSAVVADTGSAMVFKVKMQMMVSADGGTSYTPYLDFYDSAPTGSEAKTAYIYVVGGFYWEDDPPVLETNFPIKVDEGDTIKISAISLKGVDLESPPEEILFTMDPLNESLLPANGKLMKSGNEISAGESFSMLEVNNELISYIHDGGETIADSIPLTLADGDGMKFITDEDSVFYLVFTVTSINDPPVIEVKESMVLDEGASMALNDGLLLTTDAESDASEIKYTFDPEGNSSYPSHGLLKLNNVPVDDKDVFTQADINGGKVTYQHDGSESLLDGFVFMVEDATGHTAKENEDALFFYEIKINLLNDLPVLTKNATIEVNKGGEVPVTGSYLAVSDEESDETEIIFTIDPDHNIQQPNAGVLKLSGTALTDGQTFTMADINHNRVTYKQDGSSKTSDFVPFSVSDADGGVISDNGFTVFHFNINIKLSSGIESNAGSNDRLFTISPNPAGENIRLLFEGELASDTHVTLFNNAGNKLWEFSGEITREIQIPLYGYTAGSYYIIVEHNGRTAIGKIIKE